MFRWCVTLLLYPNLTVQPSPARSRRAAQAGEVRRKGRPQGGGRNPDGVAWAAKNTLKRGLLGVYLWVHCIDLLGPWPFRCFQRQIPCASAFLLRSGSGGRLAPPEVFTKLTGQETYPVYSPSCGYLLTRDLCSSAVAWVEWSSL